MDATEAFLNDINPFRRNLIMGDRAVLASSCIITAFGGTGDMLLHGTDSQNVPEWAPGGYAGKGDVLVLNHETAWRIAARKSAVGGFYVGI